MSELSSAHMYTHLSSRGELKHTHTHDHICVHPRYQLPKHIIIARAEFPTREHFGIFCI